MLLVGAWSPERTADVEILTRLGCNRAEAEQVCAELAHQPEAQVIHQKSRWSVFGEPSEHYAFANHRTAWDALASHLQPADLDRFAVVVSDALLSATAEDRGQVGLSQRMRHGLAHTLALLGHSDGRLAVTPSPAERAANMVSALLHDDDSHWQRLSDVIQLLAEAAPETFLTVLHQSLSPERLSLARLWNENPDTIKRTSHALAVLALDVDLFERAVLALAALAAHGPAPKANIRDSHPLQVLEEIFDFHYPKTNAPIDDRVTALRQMAERYPSISWTLILSLLTRRMTVLLNLPQPSVLRLTVPPRDRLTYSGEAYGQVQVFLHLAMELAAKDPVRWAELVRHLDVRAIPEELVLEALEHLAAIADGLHDEQGLIWAALRAFLHWFPLEPITSESGEAQHSEESTAERKLFIRIQSFCEQLYERLTPSDFVLRHAWVFSSEPPPKLYVSIEEEHQDLLSRQTACLSELASHPSRWEFLRALASAVEHPFWLAQRLAASDWAPELESMLLSLGTFTAYKQIAPLFLALRLLSRDPAEAEDLLRQLVAAGRQDDAVQLALALTGTADEREGRLWELLETLDGKVHCDYWKQLSLNRLYSHTARTQAQVERVVRQFVQHDRLIDAMRAAQVLKSAPSCALILDVLDAVRGLVQAHRVERERERLRREQAGEGHAWDLDLSSGPLSHNDKHLIRELLDHISPQGTEELQRVEQIEEELLPLLDLTHYVPRFLPAAVREHPELFVRLTQTEAGEALVSQWLGFPGDDLPPDQAAAFLVQWAKHVLGLLPEGKDGWTGLSMLAQLLIRPMDRDGLWPHIRVRELLEERPDLREPLRRAKAYPQRPFSIRRVGAQKNDAMASVTRIRDDITKIQEHWPQSAQLLKELAEDFSEQAANLEERESIDFPQETMPATPIVRKPLFPLQQVRIEDFRGAERIDLDLHPRLTILYGKNASGKTTVLDAIAIGLAAIARRLPRSSNEEEERLPRIRESDRRTIWRQFKKEEKAKRVSISLWGQSQDNKDPIHWFVENRWASRGPEVGDRESAQLQPYLDAVNEALRVTDDTMSMPVFVYYGVERAVSNKAKEDARPPRDIPGRPSGLAGALDGAAQFETATQWFRAMEDIEVRSKLRQPSYEHPALATVRAAVRAAIKTPDGASIRALWVDAYSSKLQVEFVRPGGAVEELEIGQLSDGFRTYLALVMDLARRMEQCNPTPEDGIPRDEFGLRSRAVVLIDEVDLHLHPAWQQFVLQGLLDAFPRTQFVVTTHSALALGSMRDATVYFMENSKAERVNAPYGKEVSTILREQGIIPRAPEVEDRINAVKALLDAGSFDQAREQTDLLDRLLSSDGNEDPDVTTLRSLLFFMAPRKESGPKSGDGKPHGGK